ncbi:hypothetical protein RRG08_003276 [Elysia crispata]|uniref:Uncharacterized protein n=1 Tax=Elysia crispata TaxID=231223 RepID=A0AAE1D0K9_9GAST|nr:hypothetical protein RRG08_003276 [Elysia crispata]
MEVKGRKGDRDRGRDTEVRLLFRFMFMNIKATIDAESMDDRQNITKLQHLFFHRKSFSRNLIPKMDHRDRRGLINS